MIISTPRGADPQVIRAELVSDDICSALGFTACARAPVLEVCRLLVAAGIDPARPLYAYRGPALSLIVRSIGEAAQLDINGKGTGFVWRGDGSTASPMRKSELPLVPGWVDRPHALLRERVREVISAQPSL